MKTSKIVLFLIIIAVIVIVFSWYKSLTPKMVYDQSVYKNTEYGFQITLPNTWKGYAVVKQEWQGNDVNGGNKKYSGPEIVIKNPQTTATQQYQDIPIMVFTPDIWQMIVQERIAVSAAPIGPAEVGQNAKYVFATPPRWYGFTDAIGWQEAVDAVKTFKGI